MKFIFLVILNISSVAWSMVEKGQPPVIKVMKNWPYTTGGILCQRTYACDLPISAADPSGKPVQIHVNNLPPGATFDSNAGKFLWRPTQDQYGSWHITIEATNGEATATEQVDITVSRWQDFVPAQSFSKTIKVNVPIALTSCVDSKCNSINTGTNFSLLVTAEGRDKVTVLFKHPVLGDQLIDMYWMGVLNPIIKDSGPTIGNGQSSYERFATVSAFFNDDGGLTIKYYQSGAYQFNSKGNTISSSDAYMIGNAFNIPVWF